MTPVEGLELPSSVRKLAQSRPKIAQDVHVVINFALLMDIDVVVDVADRVP